MQGSPRHCLTAPEQALPSQGPSRSRGGWKCFAAADLVVQGQSGRGSTLRPHLHWFGNGNEDPAKCLAQGTDRPLGWIPTSAPSLKCRLCSGNTRPPVPRPDVLSPATPALSPGPAEVLAQDAPKPSRNQSLGLTCALLAGPVAGAAAGAVAESFCSSWRPRLESSFLMLTMMADWFS